MCQYVEIISQLTKVLQDKYDDGYISKTDLIQMQTRLKEMCIRDRFKDVNVVSVLHKNKEDFGYTPQI